MKPAPHKRYAALHNSHRRFRKFRQSFLLRHPLCAHCRREFATHLDHKIPHQGDPALFWNQSNWQGLCARCDAIKTQADEGLQTASTFRTRGGRLIVTCGAPGSGKSTYAAQYEHVVSTDNALMTECMLRIMRLFGDGADPVVFDTVGEHAGVRLQALNTARRVGARAILALFMTDLDTCIARATERDRAVSPDIVRRLHASIDAQFEDIVAHEGWDEVVVMHGNH